MKPFIRKLYLKCLAGMYLKGVKRYDRNEKIREKGNLDKKELSFIPELIDFRIAEGKVYKCFEDDKMEYLMISDNQGLIHSIIALMNGINCVGILDYGIEHINGNIALKHYWVHEGHRRTGIGKKLIKSMLRSEYLLLLKGANVYVHACADEIGKDALSQEELEKHYTESGFVLCSECNSGAYEGIMPEKIVRENLKSQIHVALKD